MQALTGELGKLGFYIILTFTSSAAQENVWCTMEAQNLKEGTVTLPETHPLLAEDVKRKIRPGFASSLQ